MTDTPDTLAADRADALRLAVPLPHSTADGRLLAEVRDRADYKSLDYAAMLAAVEEAATYLSREAEIAAETSDAFLNRMAHESSRSSVVARTVADAIEERDRLRHIAATCRGLLSFHTACSPRKR